MTSTSTLVPPQQLRHPEKRPLQHARRTRRDWNVDRWHSAASWMAMCIIAYMRDSWSGLSRGAMQAAVAASPAFAFQSMTWIAAGRSRECGS